MGYGTQCTRCGRCCTAHPCGIALALLGDYRPCIALETHEDGTHSCGLTTHTSTYIELGDHTEWKDTFLGELFAHMLGVGMGCCRSPGSDAFYDTIRKRYPLLVKPKTKEIPNAFTDDY